MAVCELISVGTEILLGDILNTDAQYLSIELAKLGITVLRHTTVEHRAADGHISLPVIRLGDIRTLGGKIPAYFLGNPLVKPQLKAHRLATNVTGDIVEFFKEHRNGCL